MNHPGHQVELLPIVILTAARGWESTLSILSWHPIPRVAFACIPSVALGSLEITAPAREPSLIPGSLDIPDSLLLPAAIFVPYLSHLPYSRLYCCYFLSCNSLVLT